MPPVQTAYAIHKHRLRTSRYIIKNGHADYMHEQYFEIFSRRFASQTPTVDRTCTSSWLNFSKSCNWNSLPRFVSSCFSSRLGWLANGWFFHRQEKYVDEMGLLSLSVSEMCRMFRKSCSTYVFSSRECVREDKVKRWLKNLSIDDW